MLRRIVLFTILVSSTLCQTPVIGGTCKLGTADVQIGGKQTQFFLKCETTADSADGEGVWVVKSRAAAAAAPVAPVAAPTLQVVVPSENSQPQQHPKARKPASPNICEQDNGARENEVCAVSATCLQAHNEFPSSYLQCDQTTLRWVRKSCQEGFLFNFEQQTCIVPKRMSSLSRQQANGLLCTFSSCSNSNPCSVGTCNNGYCCSSNSNSAPAIIVSGGGGGCPGCQSAPQIITIPQNSCPGGGYSVGGCSSGYCATGYSCIQNQCCPSYSAPPRISVYTCSGGGPAVGACMSGRCASGYICQNNNCCPSTTTTNPFICSDGTQAVGGCVNGQCGTGYTCSNGLCCTGSSSTVKCLDGSDAVGACIPSCEGDGCGGVTVSYYCGSGYTCTTGNICCAINSCPDGGDVLGPTINGLCPTGYSAQGGVCCTSLCTDGTAGIAAVNGVCITGYTYTNGICCASTTSTVTCSDEISIGPCIGSGYNGGCPVGYTCDSNAVNCCPVVDYSSEACQVGPAIDGLCPPGYVVVYIPNSPLITNGVNPGTCIDVQCTTGLCAAADQIGECDQNTDTGTCPTGYTCNTSAGICCSSTTFRRLRIGKARPMVQRPNYGKPLHNYMPPRFNAQCADGSSPSGPCMNGLCGIGLECQNGQCCSPGQKQKGLQSKCPSGDTAVSGCFPNGSCGTGFECVASLKLCCPPGQPSFPISNNNNNNNNNFNGGFGSVSIRPIGSRCQLDGECVGHGEGLSMCHAGVCQCSPIAYSQGIACIRRMAFQMNDEPVIDAADEKSSSSNSV